MQNYKFQVKDVTHIKGIYGIYPQSAFFPTVSFNYLSIAGTYIWKLLKRLSIRNCTSTEDVKAARLLLPSEKKKRAIYKIINFFGKLLELRSQGNQVD